MAKVKRLVLPMMHIYCEGEKTEPFYLEKYLRKFHDGDRRREVVKIEKTRKNTPLQLVKEAVQYKLKSTVPKHDVFWVVYDRESVAKIPNEKHEEARRLAEKHGINIALSNVCFELWVLLHFVRNTAPFASYDELMLNSPLKKELAQAGLPKYEKGERKIFDYIGGDADVAKQNARDMNKNTAAAAALENCPKHLLNPYTGIPDLLDAIDDFE